MSWLVIGTRAVSVYPAASNIVSSAHVMSSLSSNPIELFGVCFGGRSMTFIYVHLQEFQTASQLARKTAREHSMIKRVYAQKKRDKLTDKI